MPPPSHHPSDQRMVAEGALSALHTEIVMYFVNAHLQREKLNQQQQQDMVASSEVPTGSQTTASTPGDADGSPSPAVSGSDGFTSAARLRPAPPAMISTTIESMGFNAGARLIERQLAAEHRLLHMTPTDAMKFVAGPLWKSIFAKKIDRLKGSHHSFNMWDLHFKWIKANSFHRGQFTETTQSVVKTVEHAPGSQSSLVSGSEGAPSAPQTHSAAAGEDGAARPIKIIEAGGPKDYLYFIVGVIRGALDTMGFSRTHVTVVPPQPNTPSQVEFRVVFAREQRVE